MEKPTEKYAGKIFYLKGPARIVRVAKQTEDILLCTGLCVFLNDASTTIMGQTIQVDDFEKQGPIEINTTNPAKYHFLNKGIIGTWKVKSYRYVPGLAPLHYLKAAIHTGHIADVNEKMNQYFNQNP